MSIHNDRRPRVLVVDDDAIIRKLTSYALQKAGFDVLEASTADEGVTLITQEGANLAAVVTDVEMPGALNGYDLAWRTYSGCPAAAVFVVSSSVDPDWRRLPPNGRFFEKPFDPGILIGELRYSLTLMERGRARPRHLLPQVLA